MVAEKYILVTQVVASFFMGLDYFFTDKQRDRLNFFLKSHLDPLRENKEQYLVAQFELARQNWISIALALLLCAFSLFTVGYIIPFLGHWLNLWLVLALITFAYLTLLGNAVKIFDVILKDGAPIVFSIIMLLISRFLIRCPKGTGFGIGLLLLALSFVFRGSNIDW